MPPLTKPYHAHDSPYCCLARAVWYGIPCGCCMPGCLSSGWDAQCMPKCIMSYYTVINGPHLPTQVAYYAAMCA